MVVGDETSRVRRQSGVLQRRHCHLSCRLTERSAFKSPETVEPRLVSKARLDNLTYIYPAPRDFFLPRILRIIAEF